MKVQVREKTPLIVEMINNFLPGTAVYRKGNMYIECDINGLEKCDKNCYTLYGDYNTGIVFNLLDINGYGTRLGGDSFDIYFESLDIFFNDGSKLEIQRDLK